MHSLLFEPLITSTAHAVRTCIEERVHYLTTLHPFLQDENADRTHLQEMLHGLEAASVRVRFGGKLPIAYASHHRLLMRASHFP